MAKKKTTTIFIELKYDEESDLDLESMLGPVTELIREIPKKVDHTISVKTESRYDW